MQCSTIFNEGIAKWNILEGPTEKLDEFFREHPNVFKVALIANHLFRAAAMSFMMLAPIGWPVCVLGSVFYRLTVEKNCAFKFALPSLAGGISFLMATAGDILNFVPTAIYFSYVVLTVDYEVDNRPCPNCAG